MLALGESKRPLWARVRNGLLIASTMSLSMALGVVAPYRFNYFLALILVTPMSLLAIDATGQGGPPAGLLADRLLGTLIGMAIALIITWATSYRFPERLLRASTPAWKPPSPLS